MIWIYYFFLSCSYLLQASDSDIKGIKVVQVFPVVEQDWNIKYDSMTFSIFARGNEMIYDFKFEDKTYKDNILDSTKQGQLYFAFTKQKKSGIMFRNEEMSVGEPVELDSVLKSTPLLTQNFNSYFSDSNNIVLLNTTRDQIKGELRERYYINSKSDTSKSSLVDLRYSTKIKTNAFSFSRELDSKHNMKLVEINLTSFPKYYPAFQKH